MFDSDGLEVAPLDGTMLSLQYSCQGVQVQTDIRQLVSKYSLSASVFMCR